MFLNLRERGEVKSGLHLDLPTMEGKEVSDESPQDACSILGKKQHKICEGVRKEVIYDAIGRQFHVMVFLEQFLSHMILPLFFFLPNKHGQGLRPSVSSLIFNIFHPVVFYVCIISFVLLPYSDQSMLGWSFWWPLLSYISHRCLLSLKYAALSPTEYKRFCDCKDKKLSESYLDQLMLFGGWLRLHPNVLYFELGAASARIGEKINEIHLLVPSENHHQFALSQVRYWNSFLRGHEYIDETIPIAPEMQKIDTGDYAVSVYDLALAVIRHCNNYEKFAYYASKICNIISLVMIIVSFIPIMKHATEFKSPVLVAFYMISSTILNWVFGSLVFLFLSLVLFDAARLKHMVEIMHCMVRSSDVMLGLSLSLNETVTETSHRYAKERSNAIIEINERSPWRGSVSLSSKSQSQKSKVGASTSPKESEEGTPKTKSLQRSSRVIGEKVADHGSEALIPRVNFNFPENIMAWAYLRITIQSFGDRFRFRTDIYAGFTLFIMLILMVMTMTFIIVSPNRAKEFTSTYVIQSLIAVTVLVAYLVLISLKGAMVNEELALQNRTLSYRALRMRSRMIFHEERCCNDPEAGEDDDDELLAKQIESIDAVMEILSVNNELRPFKFLGMTAQSALTVSILTTALSFYSVLFSLYFNGSNQITSDI